MSLVVLLALICLSLVFFALMVNLDKVGLRALLVSLVLLAGIGGALGWLHYQMSSVTGCAPACAEANLVGRTFRQMDLRGVVFVQADLSRADLSKAQLAGADLSSARLLSTNLQEADLTSANLIGADLTGANLSGAILTDANLSGAILTGASLTGVDLSQTILGSVQLNQSDLVGANLTGANLNAVNFSGAKLNGVQMLNANLSGAVLSAADLSGAQLAGSQLNGAWLNLTILMGANLAGGDLAGSSLLAANLSSADLTNSSLAGSTLIGANLKGANLNDADLHGARLDVASIITDTDFRDPVLAALNSLQRDRILVDAQLDGISYNRQTRWPESPLVATFLEAQQMSLSAAAAAVSETVKIGLLLDLSGPLAVSEQSTRDAIFLAIAELNAAGGVFGFLVEPVVEDSTGSADLALEKTLKLLETDQVVAIFGGSTSDVRKAILPAIEEAGSLLFYIAPFEGYERSPNVFYLGPDPAQQVIPAMQYLLGQDDTAVAKVGTETQNTNGDATAGELQPKTRFVLVGTEGLYSRAIHTIVKEQLRAANLEIAGELYFAAATTDFSQLISQLQASPPEAILSSLQGQSNLAFLSQLNAAGFTPQDLPVLHLTLEEEEIQQIGAAATGHWVASSYFQTIEAAENLAFVMAFKTAYGNERTVSASTAAGYSALYLWKALSEAARSTDAQALQRVAASRAVQYPTPWGEQQIEAATQQAALVMRIGVVSDDGLIQQVSASSAPLPPDPFLTQYPWAAGVQEQLGETP